MDIEPHGEDRGPFLGSCGPEDLQSHSLIPCDWLLPATVYKQDSVGGNRCFIRSQGLPPPTVKCPDPWVTTLLLQVGTVRLGQGRDLSKAP